jgi:hypothetical protein
MDSKLTLCRGLHVPQLVSARECTFLVLTAALSRTRPCLRAPPPSAMTHIWRQRLGNGETVSDRAYSVKVE